MGTFDISRINFDKTKHFTSVRMQQGRVLTDDDWNENARIENEIVRESNVDIIGPFGSPDNGFKIGNLRLEDSLINFDILPGVLYLGGLRLQLEKLETYRSQKDWLHQPADIYGTPDFNSNERYDLIYIESWQQPVSAVEDSSLFEVALGGPDTTTRLRNMRRVHIASNIGFCNCSDAWYQLKSDWEDRNLGIINKEYELIRDTKLKVTFSNTGLPEDLCTPSAAGGYLGAENQAIRVQLVDENHFTWGFDNASPLYRVAVSADGITIKMLTEPKDQYHWPLTNQIVEILPCSALLSNGEKIAEQMGHITKVGNSYDPDKDPGEFTLQEPVNTTFNFDSDDEFYLRVWNRGDDLSSDSKISFVTDTPAALGNTGLQITISGDNRVAGDFWVIAARPETPNRVVPWELEEGMLPHGVRRFFAPLAVIKWTSEVDPDGRAVVSGKIIHDCRRKFHPLSEQECCCTFTVGDGKRSNGDYNSIQEAIDNLPGNGGKICVLPGEHIANVEIKLRRQIRISGCGEQSIVRPSPEFLKNPIFLLQNSQRIQIDQLTLVAMEGTAIEVKDSKDIKIPPSERIKVNENEILAGIRAINIITNDAIGGDNRIDILSNQIGLLDKPIGKAAIFCLADGVMIADNRVVIVPAPGTDEDDPREHDQPGWDPFNPCADPRLPYTDGFGLAFQLFQFIKYVTLYQPTGRYQHPYEAYGGIQIGGSSERVSILSNIIIGGNGNGISLGHLKEESENPEITRRISHHTYSSLYDVSIEDNQIIQMGLSGISTLLNFEGEQHWVTIEDITIYRNIIQLCCRQIPEDIPRQTLNHWAFGGIVMNDCENGRVQENRIENNGPKAGVPICGVFVGYGEKLDISTNSIVNNGLSLYDNQTHTRPGSRGGIIVRMSTKIPEFKKLLDSTIPSFDGVPSIKVHNNIVNQPLGHALFLMAFGPVSVVSNQFTSLGTDKSNPLSLMASAVFILNLGVSKDIFATGFRNLANNDPHHKSNNFQNTKFQQLFRALQFLPSGMVMFSNNQTTLDMRSPEENFAMSSQLVFSLDDIAFNNNQSECAGFRSFEGENSPTELLLLNTYLFGNSLRSNDNRFMDGLTFTFYSLLSYGYMNTAMANQATRCIIGLGTLRAISNNIILIDDLCKDKKQMIRDAVSLPEGRDFYQD